MMLSIYSFKSHFLESLLNNAALLFPGADKLVAVYYDNNLPGLVSKERIPDHSGNSEIIRNVDIAMDHAVIKMRKQRPRSTWIHNLELNTIHVDSKTQLDIHSEFDNHVLLIRFPNASDRFSDLLFVYYRNEDQIFQFNKNPQKLSTSLKESVANILVRSLDAIRKQVEGDLAIYKLINRGDINLNKEIAALKKEIETKEKAQINQFRELVLSYSNPITNQTGIAFTWTDEAILKLVNSNLPFNAIKPLVENTITVMINREPNIKTTIEIDTVDLISDVYEQKPEDNTVVSIRYERTLMILDRYEKSANKVVNAGLPLTGVNLGQFCDPPVSPAAISDALKKHSKKIVSLFDKNPNRWSLLRQEFRPVKNMVYKSGLSQHLAS
jgi:hypothetical protein